MSIHPVGAGRCLAALRLLGVAVLLTGCASVSSDIRTGAVDRMSVRLETGSEPPRVFSPRPARVPVRITDAEFREALTRLVLEASLSVRPPPSGPRVVRALFHPGGASDALTRDYGRWCEGKQGPSDCLGLLDEGPSLDMRGRRQLALAMGLASALENARDVLVGMANPRAVLTGVSTAAVIYLGMWLLPEPVTKGAAAVLTVALIGYVGLDGFFALIDGWRELTRTVDPATTFAQVRAAGQRFGQRMGPHVARALVMLVGAAVGQTASGLAARVPTLPGATQAAAVAEAQVGVELPAVAGVQSVAVVAEQGLVIGLAPGAVAMSARGTDGNINSVYVSLNDKKQVQYVGITNDMARRYAEHMRNNGFDIRELLSKLSREDARAVEQALIELHGLTKSGGTLLNRINSIARSNPKYAALVQRGMQLLESMGYKVE